MSVDLERWKAAIAAYDAGEKHWPDDEQPCTIDLAEARAVVAIVEREQRWQFAVKACMEMYEEDPEYAEEWPALHHLKHVRDGEVNPDCEWCTFESDEQVRTSFMAARSPKVGDRG